MPHDARTEAYEEALGRGNAVASMNSFGLITQRVFFQGGDLETWEDRCER